MEYPPRWLREHKAVPSVEGWRRPTTKELLKSQKGLEEATDFISIFVKGITLNQIENNTRYYYDEVVEVKYNIIIDENMLTDDIINEYGGQEAVLSLLVENSKFISNNLSFDIIEHNYGTIKIKFKNYEGDMEQDINLHAKIKNYVSNTISFTVYKIPVLHTILGYDENYPMYYIGWDDILNDVEYTFSFEFLDKYYVPKNAKIELTYTNDGELVPVGEWELSGQNYIKFNYKFVNFVNKSYVGFKVEIDGLVKTGGIIFTTPPPIDFKGEGE